MLVNMNIYMHDSLLCVCVCVYIVIGNVLRHVYASHKNNVIVNRYMNMWIEFKYIETFKKRLALTLFATVAQFAKGTSVKIVKRCFSFKF